MPVKSFTKVSKHIKEKKKGKINALHEHSRDARRLQRASARDDKLAVKIAAREKANLPHRMYYFHLTSVPWIYANAFLVQRISFLQSCLPSPPEPLTPYSISDIQSLLELFFARFDEDLAALKAERRPGRPPVTRETAIKNQLDADRKEYDSGLWIPDLRDEETLFSLRNWQGDWSGLNIMKFVRVTRSGDVRDSSFPPKGQS